MPSYKDGREAKRNWEKDGSQTLRQLSLKPYSLGYEYAWEELGVSPPSSWQWWRWKRGKLPDDSIVHIGGVVTNPKTGNLASGSMLLKFELGHDLPGKFCDMKDGSVVGVLDCKQPIRYWPGTTA